MKKHEIKTGQLVKLIDDPLRWSDFVNLGKVGVVLSRNNGQVKVLFSNGDLEDHWYFSLESVKI